MNDAYPYPPAPTSPQDGLAGHIPAARSAYNRVGLGMLVFILVPQLVSLVLAVAALLAFPAFYQSAWYAWFNQVLCMYMIGAPLALLVIGLSPQAPGHREKRPLSVPQLLGIFCIMETVALLGSIISGGLMQLVSSLTGGEYTSPVEELLAGAPWWLLLTVVGVIGPILEELICREALMRRLLPFGEKSAIFFSALLFGLMHGNFYQLFYAVGLGAILAYVYARTNNIAYPCILHAALNSLSCLQSIAVGAVDIDTLQESASLGAQMEWLRANLLPYLATILLTLLVYGLAIAGFVLLIRRYRRLSFGACPFPLPKEGRLSAWLGNVGMILFFVTSFLLIGLTLIPA